MDYNTVANDTKTALENTLFSEVSKLNTGIDTATLRGIVSRVAESQSSQLVKDVYDTGNSQLETLPTRRIGINNPVNITSSNLGSTGLFNNINGTVNNQLSSQTTNRLLTALQTELTNTVPGISGRLNLNSLTNNLAQAIAPSVNGTISSTLKTFTDSIFSNTPTVPSSVPGVQSLLNSLLGGGASPTEAIAAVLEKVDLDFSTGLASKTLTQVENYDIKNPDNDDKLIATKKGFIDPSATYPTKEYAGQPETNKLARGEISGTIVQKKNDERVIGAKLPFNNSFSEPPSPFNGVYPYNKVTQTESGHIIEVDDTPGNERIHVYHKSGTYIEIDANGTVVKRTRGSSYEIIDCNGKIAILGKADVSINGECNIFVGNDCNMEVIGDVNLTCHNDITAQAGGKLNLSAREEINIHSANVYIEADNFMSVLSDGAMKVMSEETMHARSNAKIQMSSLENMHLSSINDNVSVYAGGEFNLLATQDVRISSQGATNITASGNFAADGQATYLQSDYAVAATQADTAIFADMANVSNIGLLETRGYIDKVDINDPEPIRYDARITEEGEGSLPTQQELTEQKDTLVTLGIATKDELDDPNPVVVEEATPSSGQGKIIMPDRELLKVTELPGNFSLSPNFTLDNMWRTVAVSPGKHNIRSQNGLTYGDIVYNLQALALNVLEPVKALYPKMIITSAFRHNGENSKSAHSAGLACDLQFPGASRAEYYDIAVKLAQVLAYDQILLEYWVQANNPWIHIGVCPPGVFNPASMRKVAWTFKDHALYKQNLVNLA